MGRIPPLVASSLGLLLCPEVVWAQPPSLPDTEAAEAAPPPPASGDDAESAPAPASPTAEATAESTPAAGDSAAAEADDSTASVELDSDPSPTRAEDLESAPLASESSDPEAVPEDFVSDDPSDPGVVRGHREPLMNTNRGAAGLFTTVLPDAGGKYTFRFKLHTDFFRRERFIYEGPAGPDQHARVRGGVALAFSPFEWGELFLSINSQANRNAREQNGRQDAEAVFALGDVDFGVKGAHRLTKYGIGIGGQVGVGLLSGSDRLLTSGANVWFDGLFSLDLRYLTAKQFPFRFTTNIGWIFDNSLNIAPYGRISDDISREVIRFSLGSNHNRLRMRYAVDFPIRLGKERQFGIDPIAEWSWDVSTQEESIAFGRDDAVDSPLPRSSQWVTVGARANVVSGLHLEAAADIGLVSPNFEFGPPVPPWQVMLALGWSFDPQPVVKEVHVPTEVPAAVRTKPPALEGRIVGQVVDPNKAPVANARIAFPGLTSTMVLTDANGSFTSFRFPEGSISVQVMMDGAVVAESVVDVSDGEDTALTVTLDAAPAPATGIVQGAVTDPTGAPVAFSMRVVGQGVDQSFESTPGGLIALELYVGEYSGTITAPGFKPKPIQFTVPEGREIQLAEQLQADVPPDTSKVRASRSSIRLSGGIGYKGTEVSPRSHEGLDQLATFLNSHPEYAMIRIGVHTDDQGSPKKRSQARADAVKAYLVGKGVSPSRIEAKGYGDNKPVAVNLTAAGRAKNNRTTIAVVTMDG